MHFINFIGLAALPILASAAGGPNASPFARVENNCDFPVYVRSVLNAPSGGAPSAVQLGPRLSGYYSEALKVGGGKLNVGVTPYLSAPLSMGYNPTNGLVYYDLSNQFGNPFPQYRNTVTPSNVSCYKFNCAPNDELCYSNGKHIRVQACQAPTSLTMRVCA